DKIIGMIQPCMKTESSDLEPTPLSSVGCLGRITAIQETGDGRYLLSLTGICRYKLTEEIPSNKGYRTCRAEPFSSDIENKSCQKDEVDREKLLEAFRNYLGAHGMDADWDTIGNTDNETLVTALCMMSPYEPAEKQALLEAPDLKTRTETLIAISEMHLARSAASDGTALQ
ncbi:MAG: LON peptidase substrate-binding domain-containing protein, partial [Pseudomonadota bacterium]